MKIFIRFHKYLQDLSRYDFLGLLSLRLYLFYVFWFKGTVKLSQMKKFNWDSDSLGSMFSEIANWLMISLEIGCAISLLVGLFVRWSAMFLLVVTFSLIFSAILQNNWSLEFNSVEMLIIYFIMLAILLFSGGGRYFSLDYWVSR